MDRSALGILFILLSVTSLVASERDKQPSAAGPVYLPLDSWIYPALKRLAALDYVPDEEGLAAPWTRSECLTLVKEAEDIASRHSTKVSEGARNDDTQTLIASFKHDFVDESNGRARARIESIYTRLLQVGGSPLQDSYHFGQTIVNDYGRPYGTGTNAVTGFSAFGILGPYPATFGASIRKPVAGRLTVKAYKIRCALSTACRPNRPREPLTPANSIL